MPVISKWKFERCTTSRQPEGSNFKPYPFFNWTQDKCSCITCKKEIRQKSFADHRLYNVQLYNLCKKKQKANHSLTLDIITKADFFQKLIYPPFNVTVVALNTYLCPVDKNY